MAQVEGSGTTPDTSTVRLPSGGEVHVNVYVPGVRPSLASVVLSNVAEPETGVSVTACGNVYDRFPRRIGLLKQCFPQFRCLTPSLSGRLRPSRDRHCLTLR